MSFKLEGLYAITDEILTPDEIVLEKAKEALKSGVNILQYRNKTKSDEEVEEICLNMQNLCREFNVAFIIDDRPHLAQKIGADGIHIGKDDIELSKAKKIFTKGIIGVSCYGSISKAKKAQEGGANYVAFGSFFHSPTKPKSGIVSKSIISRAKNILKIPICVIGGINQENISSLVEEKPDIISVVSGVFDGDISSNVKALLQKMR